MADRDYHPKLGKKFDHARNLLFAGKTVEAGEEVASKVLDEARETLTKHAELFDICVQQLWQLDQLDPVAREIARFQPIPEASDKHAETLRRAACEMHVRQQVGLASFFSEEELRCALGVLYLQAEECRLFRDPLEADTAYGEIETDQRVPDLLQQLQVETERHYAAIIEAWRMGTPPEDLKVKKSAGARRTKVKAGHGAPLNLDNLEGNEE